MPKLSTGTAVEPPSLHWEPEYLALTKTKDGLAELLTFAWLVVDLYETIATGNEAYLTFGRSRNGGKPLLTYTVRGEKLYASGDTLGELAEAIKDLL